MEKLPYISVVITAYNRKEFLLDAIDSVINQTLDKKFYEIIVIKNFKDEKIDDFIKTNDIKDILMDGTIGAFLNTGIRESKGDIISFLDDDDYFDSGKLENVFIKSRENMNIVYFYNNRIIVTEEKNFIRKNGHIEEGKLDSEEIFNKSLNIGNLLFNVSSISIKKEYYLKYTDYLFKLNDHQDDFFLFCAMNEKKEIYLISSYSTYYRVHNSSSNINIQITNKNDIKRYSNSKNRILKVHCEASHYLSQCFTNEELKKIIMFRYKIEAIELNFYTKNSLTHLDLNFINDLLKYILKNGFIKLNSEEETTHYILHKILLILKYSYFSIFNFSEYSALNYKLAKLFERVA